MEILGLLALVLIIGALLGGKDVPESIRLGCGCLVGLAVVLVVVVLVIGVAANGG